MEIPAHWVTLSRAALLKGRQRLFWYPLRKAWELHPDYPFPEPRVRVNGQELYDPLDLELWLARKGRYRRHG